MKTLMPLVPLAVLLATISCTGESTMTTTKFGQAPAEEVARGLDVLATKKAFFGHQSVGLNIMDGLRDVAASGKRATPAIIETRSAEAMTGPGLYHAPVGKNTDPLSKLRDFEVILRSGVAEAVDVAFLKFCYVDFDESTDVPAVFTAYRDAMKKLQADHPKLMIVHFTAPLTTDDSGIKALVKRIIGRKLNGYGDNVKREQFNNLMRAEYDGKEPFFDIALIEASDDSGAVRSYGTDTSTRYAMRQEYTFDSGHLNEAGRSRAAGWLAVTLDEAVR